MTRHIGYNAAPAWSPNGQWMAFLSDRDGGLEVYIMDDTGHYLRRLTHDDQNYSRPRFSTDGGRVLFSTIGTRQTHYYSVNLDGSRLQEITPDTTSVRQRVADTDAITSGYPRSPDGTHVMSLRFQNQRWGIYVASDSESHMAADMGPDFIEMLVWSPNGLQIAFVSNRDGTADLTMPSMRQWSGSR